MPLPSPLKAGCTGPCCSMLLKETLDYSYRHGRRCSSIWRTLAFERIWLQCLCSLHIVVFYFWYSMSYKLENSEDPIVCICMCLNARSSRKYSHIYTLYRCILTCINHLLRAQRIYSATPPSPFLTSLLSHWIRHIIKRPKRPHTLFCPLWRCCKEADWLPWLFPGADPLMCHNSFSSPCCTVPHWPNGPLMWHLVMAPHWESSHLYGINAMMHFPDR